MASTQRRLLPAFLVTMLFGSLLASQLALLNVGDKGGAWVLVCLGLVGVLCGLFHMMWVLRGT